MLVLLFSDIVDNKSEDIYGKECTVCEKRVERMSDNVVRAPKYCIYYTANSIVFAALLQDAYDEREASERCKRRRDCNSFDREVHYGEAEHINSDKP